MWYLHVRADPDPASDLALRYAGAEICCWVDTFDEGVAMAAADEMLRSFGWLMRTTVEESRSVTRDRQPAKSLEYYDLAADEGFAHVAIAWRK